MKNLGSSFRKLLLTVTVGLGFVASAQAAVYVGSWDPKFSNAVPVDQIGWSGQAILSTQGTCSGSGWTSVLSCGGSFSAKVTSATVTIYEMVNVANKTSFSFSSFDDVGEVFVNNGVISGWTAANSNFVTGITLPPALNTYTNFQLYWDRTGPRMNYATANPFTTGVNSPSTLGGDYVMQYSVTAVPEASSLAMMVAGLGLVGFIGRKRKMRSGIATL